MTGFYTYLHFPQSSRLLFIRDLLYGPLRPPECARERVLPPPDPPPELGPALPVALPAHPELGLVRLAADPSLLREGDLADLALLEHFHFHASLIPIFFSFFVGSTVFLLRYPSPLNI